LARCAAEFEKFRDVGDNAICMAPTKVRSVILGYALLLGIAGCAPATDEGVVATASSASSITALAPMMTPSRDASSDRPLATDGAASSTIEDGGQLAPAGSIDLRELPPSDSAAADLVELPVPGVPDPLAKAVQLAREDLSARLHSLRLQPEDIEKAELVRAESMVWNDRSLGCPRPNTGYLAEETAGFKIVLSAGGESYTYHTDLGQNVVLCLDGEPAPLLE
jgi:hypothetical protein